MRTSSGKGVAWVSCGSCGAKKKTAKKTAKKK
jgi:hypothetical protein